MKMNLASVMWVEFKRGCIMLRRYPTEAVAGIVVFTIIFFALLKGASYLADSSNFGSRINVVVVNYVIWLTTIWLFVGPSSQIVEDAQTGVLEQLLVSRSSYAGFAVIRIVCGLSLHLLLISVILCILLVITSVHLDFSSLRIVPFLCLVASAAGTGLLVASYALIVKRVSAFLSIGQFALLFITATPFAQMGEMYKLLGWILPMASASQILKDELALGRQPDLAEVLVTLCNAGAYFFAGYIALHLSTLYAKRHGLLSGY